jgi:hypothetical protein
VSLSAWHPIDSREIGRVIIVILVTRTHAFPMFNVGGKTLGGSLIILFSQIVFWDITQRSHLIGCSLDSWFLNQESQPNVVCLIVLSVLNTYRLIFLSLVSKQYSIITIYIAFVWC